MAKYLGGHQPIHNISNNRMQRKHLQTLGLLACVSSVVPVCAKAEIKNEEDTELTTVLHNFISGIDYENYSTVVGDNILLNLRGKRSFDSDNNPLIVLNDVPFLGSLYDIDVHDIESIAVYKDVASSTIYGARGRNGVISIKTKRTSTSRFNNQKKITYQGTVGVNTVFSPYPMMDGGQMEALRNYIGMPVDFKDEHQGTSTDWQDLLYQNGLRQSHNVGVQSGWQSGGVHLGVGYMKQEGVIPTQSFKRVSGHVNIEQNLGQYVRLSFNSFNTYNKQEGGNISPYGLLIVSPLISPYDANGDLRSSVDGYMYDCRLSLLSKDYLKNDYIHDRISSGSYNVMSAVVSNPWVEGLKYHVNYAFNYRDYRSGSYRNEMYFLSNHATLDKRVDKQHTLDQKICYSASFGDSFELSADLDYAFESYRSTMKSEDGYGVPVGSEYNEIASATNDYTMSFIQDTDPAKWHFFTARLNFGIKSWASIGASLHRDAIDYPMADSKYSSWSPMFNLRLTGINKLFRDKWPIELVPSISFGQMKDVRTYSEFKDPLSLFGKEGDEDPIEDVRSWNYDIGFSAFEERVTGQLSFYRQESKNLWVKAAVPPMIDPMREMYLMYQGAAMENRGFEFNVDAKLLRTNDWWWNIGLRLWHNKNKITRLYDKGYDQSEIDNYYVGHSINSTLDYQYEGIWNTDDPDWKYINILEPGLKNPQGMIKVKYTGERDSEGRPLRSIGLEDRQIISLDPKLQGSFNTTLRWRMLDLSVVGYFQVGGKLISTLHGSYSYLNQLNGRMGQIDVDYWTPDNMGAKYPDPKAYRNGSNLEYASSLSYFDASQLRVSDITLGYNIIRRGMCYHGESRPKIGLLRVYATVQNPFVLFSLYQKECGLDPQPNCMSDQSVYTAALMNGHPLPVVGVNAPSMRSWLIGLTIEL